ncbi:hypothetical protein DMH27_05680 [Raoultella planticola]|nr:hypothetical protein [Raoultella planticola]
MIAIIIHPGIIRFYPVTSLSRTCRRRRSGAAVYRTGAPDDALFTLCRLLNGRRAERRLKGSESPPAASASEPIADDLINVRRLTPPECS